MALEHTKFPIYGLQFHPESILSEDGKEILIRFLNLLPGVSIPTKQQTPQQPKKALLPYAEKVLNGENLTETEAMEAMDLIMSNAATDIQIAEFLTALRMKGETIEEITGFAKGMRARQRPFPIARMQLILSERAATARTRSTFLPLLPSSLQQLGRRLPSTATAACPVRAVQRMCWNGSV